MVYYVTVSITIAMNQCVLPLLGELKASKDLRWLGRVAVTTVNSQKKLIIYNLINCSLKLIV